MDKNLSKLIIKSGICGASIFRPSRKNMTKYMVTCFRFYALNWWASIIPRLIPKFLFLFMWTFSTFNPKVDNLIYKDIWLPLLAFKFINIHRYIRRNASYYQNDTFLVFFSSFGSTSSYMGIYLDLDLDLVIKLIQFPYSMWCIIHYSFSFYLQTDNKF